MVSIKRALWFVFLFVSVLILTSPAFSQQPASRIASIDGNQRTQVKGTLHPLVRTGTLLGHADPATKLTGVTLYFKPTDAQQAALKTLLAAQTNPGSPSFHKWLTPAQYEARFGLSTADTNRVNQWLSAQGLTVSSVSPTHIAFSGDVTHVEAALQTTINRYQIQGVERLANASEIALPSAVANVTLGVRNLAEFRPRPRVRLRPRYNYSNTGEHFLAPDDFTTIYDVKALYNAGYTGSGQNIVVVGQSEILTSDVDAFRAAAGLTAKDPTLTLMPGTGTAVETKDGDEEESDLDVEWSGAIAKAASINFVYVGNDQNYSVFDALTYAVDNNLAPVISISYGACEAQWSASDVSTLTSTFEQANAQGQTIVAASGDNGAADCDEPASANSVVTSAQDGLAVDLPAASPYVTGVGGTEFSGDVSSPGTYWGSSNNSSNGSAVSYIPEMAWNDTDTTTPSNGLSASGGGKSILFSKPSWQTGTGVPADGARDVPDVALNASPDHDGYLFCSQGSCTNGFLDSQNEPNVAGGTSFGAPTFSGILTLINQELGSSGQGNINPSLYALAASTPAAFHDITVGNNEVPCTLGKTDCESGTAHCPPGTSPTVATPCIGYVTGVGYDQVTGLGSIDANELATAFSVAAAPTPTLVSTTTDLTASTSSITVGTAVTFTATVSPSTGSTAPTGTVQFAVDGTNSGTAVMLGTDAGSASSAQASFSTTFTTAGSHTIIAVYSGNTTDATSTGTLTINAASTTKAFTLSATNVTVAQGSSGTSTITVTPAGGYTGTVAYAVTGPASLTNTCFSVGSASVTGTTAVTSTLTINTTETACATAGRRPVAVASILSGQHGNSFGFHPEALIGLLLLPFATLRRFRKSRWQGSLLVLSLMTAGVLAMNGCGGGGSSSTTIAQAAQGTYTLTVTGTDSTANITNTTTLTLTIN